MNTQLDMKQSAASDLLQQLQQLAEMTQAIAAKVDDKTHGFRLGYPTARDVAGRDEPEIPPYFSEARILTHRISEGLDDILRCIDTMDV